MILVACLAQSGGEITVTQGTLDQCAKNLEELDYVIGPGKEKNEFIVRLVQGKDVAEAEENPVLHNHAGEVIDGQTEVAGPAPVEESV